MDRILLQMIAIDDDASRRIKNAEAEAAAILEKARLEGIRLEKQMNGESLAESEELIRQRVEVEEQACIRELVAEDVRLREERRRLEPLIPPLAGAIANRLAYPRSSPPFLTSSRNPAVIP